MAFTFTCLLLFKLSLTYHSENQYDQFVGVCASLKKTSFEVFLKYCILHNEWTDKLKT